MGIDLGGTKIEGVLLRLVKDDQVEELVRLRVPTQRELGYEAVLEKVASLIERVAQQAGVALCALPIGVGMPGGVRRDGCVKNSNTTCLNGRPFRRDLKARMGRALAFDNDANCFALAEARFGAGAPWRDGVVFGVILGTGVGGGLVSHGAVWSGPQGIAGEWGHHVVWAAPPGHDARSVEARPCYCGQRGCVEAYVCGPAVEADYLRRSGRSLDLASIVARVDLDEHARAAVDVFLASFGRGLANVINILDPSVVVLGGGLSNVELLYTEGTDLVRRGVFNEELATPIVRNKLGDSAGVLGAALLPDARSRGRAC